MCSRRAPPAYQAPHTRSAVSNGTRLHAKADARSASARRFRDLIRAYTDEVGSDLSESELALVRQAAALTMRAEQMQADIVNGEPVDSDALIRIAGTAKRLLGAISAKASARKPNTTLTLADHLARRATESATDNDKE
jgi:hypothetical protein